jgi:hypothetical protein
MDHNTRIHFSGQYYASDPVIGRMQDIATDLKRAGLRAAVGKWELDTEYKRALAADDELDRRRAMREAAVAAPPTNSEQEAA